MKDHKALIREKQIEIDALMVTVREKEAEINMLKSEIEYKKTGFKVGDIIENKSGVKGVLSSYSGWSWSWRKLKKDGEPSKVESYVYDIKGCRKVGESEVQG